MSYYMLRFRCEDEVAMPRPLFCVFVNGFMIQTFYYSIMFPGIKLVIK